MSDETEWSTCHCGLRADGHLPGYCDFCSQVRCDADPGACNGGPTYLHTYANTDPKSYPREDL